jgi:signal transduction histidine kinase
MTLIALQSALGHLVMLARSTHQFKPILVAILFLASLASYAQTDLPLHQEVLVLDQASVKIYLEGIKDETDQRIEVKLPYHWDKMHQARSGLADFELAFQLPAEPTSLYALFLPRLGNRFELWINDVLISRSAGMGSEGALDALHWDFGKTPRYFAIPPSLLKKSNVLRIRLEADGGRRAGLTAALIGSEPVIRKAYERAYLFRISSAIAVVTLMLVLAALNTSLWLTQSTQRLGEGASPHAGQTGFRDPVYGYTVIATAAWSLRLGDHLIERSPLPWPAWGVVTGLALGTCLLCIYALLICLAQAQNQIWAQRYLKNLPYLIAASVAASAGALYLRWPWLLSAWYVFLWLLGAAMVVWFVARTLRQGDINMRLMSCALLLNLTATASDLWRFRLGTDLNDNSWASMASATYAFALYYIVITRFRSASVQARELTQNLQARVAEREAALALSYNKLEALSREQERTLERTRILRDLHDGVGAHISAAIWQVQSGQSNTSQLLQTLRDSQDQLKLSIDSMQLQAGDVTVLLANLRYRLGSRLESGGLQLHWEVDDLPILPQLDHSAMQHLQYMLFEALSNVLQHAGATVLKVQASLVKDRVKISVIDNGRGLDAAQPSRGLAMMRDRAKAIGADLAIESTDGQTAVRIGLATGLPAPQLS